jgi:hypothetical protein
LTSGSLSSGINRAQPPPCVGYKIISNVFANSKKIWKINKNSGKFWKISKNLQTLTIEDGGA